MKNQSTQDRFMEKVRITSGCWEWVSVLNHDGYGQFWYNKKTTWAHRMSWILFRGEIPPGKYVLHHCDNPSCVNPNHLFLGTQFNNVQDAIKKGRMRKACGEKHGLSKLTEKQVQDIRKQVGRGIPQTELVNKYHVGRTTISCVVNRQTWVNI